MAGTTVESPPREAGAPWLRVVLPFVLGCAGAVVGSWLTRPASAPSPRATDHESSPREASLSVEVQPSSDVDHLARRVAELERRNEGAGDEAPTAPTTPSEESARRGATTPEAEAQEIADLHRRLVSEFRDEPLDPAWSARATTSFTSDVQRLSESAGVQLRSLECRSHRCRAELAMRTPGAEGIRRASTVVMGHPFGMNCQRTVYFVARSAGGDDGTGFVEWECASTELPGPPATASGI